MAHAETPTQSTRASVTLRKSGGSVVLSIPPAILAQANLGPSDAVHLEVERGQLIVTAAEIDSELKATPELLRALAESHAAVARAHEAVEASLAVKLPEARQINYAAIRAEVAQELSGDTGRRVVDFLFGQAQLGEAA